MLDFNYAVLALILSTTRTHFSNLKVGMKRSLRGVFGILSTFISRTVILYSFRFLRFFLTSKN